MYKLHEQQEAAPRGRSCGKAGVFVGADCPLVTPDEDAEDWYRVRDIDAINRALSVAYGIRMDLTGRMLVLERLAKLMTDGQWGLAQVTALQLRLPDLPERGAGRLRGGNRLLRFNPNHRLPGPGGGQFTSAPQGAGARTAPAASRTGTTTRSRVRVNHTPGVVVRLPNGEQIADPKSPTGYLMSPVVDLRDVAQAGRDVGSVYRTMLSDGRSSPGAIGYLIYKVNAAVGQGGKFDYQRKRAGQGFVQYPQFRPVANFNVGLFMQQTGAFSLDETLIIAGAFARFRSSNARRDQPHDLDPITAYWIRQGYHAGAKGAFGKVAGS